MIVLLGLGASAPGCVEDCEECQAALDHMASKIEANGCQPSLMQNAVNRIRRDCDDGFVDWYIGRMVEECQAGFIPTPACETHTVFGMDFRVFNQLDEPITVLFSVEGGDAETLEDIAPAGMAERDLLFQTSGSSIAFEVFRAQGDPLVSGESALVLRTNPAVWEPWNGRTVTVAPDPDPGAPPSLVFEHWE